MYIYARIHLWCFVLQEAVLEVILHIKAHHEAAVLKRATASRSTHRTGHMCDRAITSTALTTQ
jgi:hypothetical protein